MPIRRLAHHFHQKPNITSITISQLPKIVQLIHQYGYLSRIVINFNKSKSLHLCDKHKCSFPNHTVQLNNHTIESIPHLQILGIYFKSRYNWTVHCTNPTTAPNPRLNILKYLSSKTHIHINTLSYFNNDIIFNK